MKPKEVEKVGEKLADDGGNEAVEAVRAYPRVDKRHAAYKILVDSGIDKKEAAEILGYKPKSAYEIEKRLEKKGKRIEVTTQKMVRKSVRNLEKLVDAQPFGTLQSIKDSTVLAAIQVILDRSHPKREEISLPANNYTVVYPDGYKPDPPNSPYKSYNLDLIRMDHNSPADPADSAVDVTPEVKPRTGGES